MIRALATIQCLYHTSSLIIHITNLKRTSLINKKKKKSVRCWTRKIKRFFSGHDSNLRRMQTLPSGTMALFPLALFPPFSLLYFIALFPLVPPFAFLRFSSSSQVLHLRPGLLDEYKHSSLHALYT